MSTKIQKDFTFLSSIHFENKFLLNFYEMVALMSVEVDDVYEQNIAIERMNYFLTNQIEDSLFINEKDTEALEKYKAAGMKTIVIPDDPYDQIIGHVLINKCNAIMEGRIIVEEIIFGSKLSNLIKFNISCDETDDKFIGNHWWNDPNLSVKPKKKKDKIVKLFDQQNWETLELTWKRK